MRWLTVSLAILALMCLISNDTRLSGISSSSNPQETPTPTPKPNTRCSPMRVPECPNSGAANTPPDVKLKASGQKIVLHCQEGATSPTCTSGDSQQIQLQALASDTDGDTLRYSYSTTGGRISGEGPNVTWDLTGVLPGTYTASVEADDACGCVAFSSAQVKVESCSDCSAATSR